MKKKKLILIGVLVLCVGSGAIFAVARNTAKAGEANTEGTAVTAVVKQDLEKDISVSGTISSAATYNVSSEVANVKITDIRVRVGDTVKAGDVLATLDKTGLEASLKSAKNAADIAGQQGNLSIGEAERNYNATVVANDTAVKRAQDALNNAVATRDSKNQNVSDAQSSFEKAKNDYNSADDLSKEAAKSAMELAETKLETAKEEAKAADSAVTSAQQALEDANIARVKNDADSADALTGSRLSAQSSAQTAGDSVRQAKEQLAKTTLVAPADGMVTSINGKIGDVYAGGALIVIQDVSGFKVSATMDQYDISDVSNGLSATITTDTTGSEKMTGTVTFVSPTPTAQTSVSSESTQATAATGYPIEVTIDNPSERLRIGMNAKLTIVVSTAKNALSVPAAAIQQDEDGNYYVEVAEDEDKNGIADSEDFRKISVQQGLVTDYYVQIMGEGIDENTYVVIPTEDVEISDVGLF